MSVCIMAIMLLACLGFQGGFIRVFSSHLFCLTMFDCVVCKSVTWCIG